MSGRRIWLLVRCIGRLWLHSIGLDQVFSRIMISKRAFRMDKDLGFKKKKLIDIGFYENLMGFGFSGHWIVDILSTNF